MCEAITMNLFTISSSFAMVDMLAKHVMEKYGDSPHQLSRVLIFLPSHRAIGYLREAFLRASDGKALLLPQMVALGDIEEKLILRNARPSPKDLVQLQTLLPATEMLDRLISLSRLVYHYGEQTNKNMRFDQAVQLADQLAEMLDELQREQVDTMGFDTLVPEEFARQWQETLAFSCCHWRA